MRYHDIYHDNMNNGEGLRTVLWVAGCNHHCKNCQNPDTWDPNGGIPFDEDAHDELFDALEPDYCDGLTLSGGDPLYPQNRKDVLKIIHDFRLRFWWTKTIWLYTGYTMDELEKENDADVREILYYIDVLVDGPYIEEQRNTKRYWVGSDNQEIWKKDEHGRLYKSPKEYEKSITEMNLDEQHHKECGCG